ncbi:MAG: bacillithiol biosynthesis cysteine-adding enzyme BshC [Acidobacteriaceae bacterium]|nr:bacillithiol biosynthesis cysteine-adding enzyme BshC [Acidobacteriaceae bacterium]MBV9501612.1 bacillithiol biosynthesis cysteine-adding enzyme BshC [Acidobacteriaceae bacterium]
MEPSCVRHNLIPGTSRLFEDFLYDFDRVAPFYSHPFSNFEEFIAEAKALNYPADRRTRLVSALREQDGQSAGLSKLAEPATVAVVTGQQVGLFSGPAYTIFKALTAVKLAAELEQHGVPAVPVFWLATQDHDIAEVDHAWVFNEQLTPTRISVANTVAGGGPVGEVELRDLPLEELRRALGELPFADEVTQRLTCAYQSRASFGSAFRVFLKDLLGRFGLLFVDPLKPAMRELSAPFLAGVVPRVAELVSRLQNRNKELTDAGYHNQVHVEDETSLLFLLSEGKRTALRFKDGKFAWKDRQLDACELKAMATDLSPNALLRPVMQDYLLPTVSYVGGPAEIAYLAQSQVLYQELLGRMPVIFPRNSFTLLDARATKLMNRYGLHLTDLLDFQEHVKGRIAARLVPAGLVEHLEELERSTSAALEDAQDSLAKFDPTLQSAAKKSSAKILYQIHRLSEKTARETLRRDERAAQGAEYLINLIYPHRRLQERFYSIVPFLAKYGLDLPDRLLAMTQTQCPDHTVRTI